MTMIGMDMTLSALPDVGRLPKVKIAATEIENGMKLFNGMSLRPHSNGYPYIGDRAGFICDTADIARRWLITGIQNGGH